MEIFLCIDDFYFVRYTSRHFIVVENIVDNSEQEAQSGVYAALSLAWQLGYTIVLPLLIFGAGGRYLDKRFGSAPFLYKSNKLFLYHKLFLSLITNSDLREFKVKDSAL